MSTFTNLASPQRPYVHELFGSDFLISWPDGQKVHEQAMDRFYDGDFAGATQQLDKAIAGVGRFSKAKDKDIAVLLTTLGENYLTFGDIGKAAEILERALGFCRTDSEADRLLTARILKDQALASMLQGSLSDAPSLLDKCISLQEKKYDTEHPAMALTLQAHGLLYLLQGNYADATTAINRGSAILQKAFGKETIPYGQNLNLLGMIQWKQGDYAEAVSSCRQSLMILEKSLGMEHPIVGHSLNTLGLVYQGLAEYDKALPVLKRNLVILEKTVGTNNLSVAMTLKILGLVCYNMGRPHEALSYFERNLVIYDRIMEKDTAPIATTLNNIALAHIALGNYRQAAAFLKRCLAILSHTAGEDHPEVAVAMHNLGGVYHRQRKYEEAANLYNKSLKLSVRAFGVESPLVISILGDVAMLAMDWGDTDAGIHAFITLFGSLRPYCARQFAGLPDSDALKMIERFNFYDEAFHSICAAGTNCPAKAINAGAEQLALNKALLEEVQAFRSLYNAKSQTPTLQQELVLADIARSLSPRSVLVDCIQYCRYDFAAKTNQWKEQRYAAYLTFPRAHDSTNVVVERVDLGEAAPISEAVELVCKRMSAGQFAAKDVAAALQRLSDLVYAPLAKHLTNFSHLILCPDGQLSRLPFEALPCGSNGNKFLIEEKAISYVTSGREVVRIANPLTRSATSVLGNRSADLRSGALGTGDEPGRRPALLSSGGGRTGRGAVGKSLVMGNPDFDFNLPGRSRWNEALTKTSQLSTNNSQPDRQRLLTSAVTRTLSRDFRGLKFNPLPGSGMEATDVAKLLGADATLRLGADAREAELKAVQSPLVLHLATHGFFLSDQEFRHTNSGRADLLVALDARQRVPTSQNDWENPLVRCGIALAGANHATNVMSRSSRREEAQTTGSQPSTTNSQPDGQSPLTSAATRFEEEDGILTGLEAALLNLQGTELVILSACDSGTGEVKIGEGVMSLRRAFRIAGAETVLASHWPVNDKATSQLMTEFMRRWRAGQPRAKVWREAQLALLRSKDFSNPYFWAAFTLTGQWN